MGASRRDERIPDEELESLCAPTRWEQGLQRFGCVAGVMLATALAIVTLLRREDPWTKQLLAVLVGALPGALVFLYFLGLYGRRREALVVASDRRLGRAALWRYVDEARADLGAAGGPDRIVLLTAQALPMGNTHWVRVALHATTGSVAVRTTAGETASAKSGALLPEEALAIARLVAVLDDPVAKRSRLDSPGVRDGFPVSVAILRRGWDATFDFNLAGVSPEGAAHAAVGLVRLVLEVETRVAGSQHVAGFGDVGGDVRIAPV